MPVIMKRIYNISGNYTDSEKAMFEDLIDAVRLRIADDNVMKNFLYKHEERITDEQIVSFSKEAARDLNSGNPPTRMTVEMFYKYNSELLVEGVILFYLISKGILHLENQIDFNDSGLSIAMFNKTGLYQSWYGTLLNSYLNGKQQFKSGVIPNSVNSGFHGINSEFGYRWC